MGYRTRVRVGIRVGVGKSSHELARGRLRREDGKLRGGAHEATRRDEARSAGAQGVRVANRALVVSRAARLAGGGLDSRLLALEAICARLFRAARRAFDRVLRLARGGGRREDATQAGGDASEATRMEHALSAGAPGVRVAILTEVRWDRSHSLHASRQGER